MGNKRLFIAIPLLENLQKEIIQFQGQFQRQFRNLNVRWLQGKNLHITLIPPWYESDLERVKTALKQLKQIGNKISPFQFQCVKAAFGPDPRYPRLIWSEGETPQEMIQLKKELEQILLKEKIIRETEKRPFRLHITIARFRPEDFKKFPIQKLDEKVSWTENVSSIVLMESHLSPHGAQYEILEEISIS